MGPEVYRLARSYPPGAAERAVERLIGVSVVEVDRIAVGASHAVYAVRLQDGRDCIARFATHPEHELDLELWALECARQVGVPVPQVFAADLSSAVSTPQFAVYARVAGHPGHHLPLGTEMRRLLFEHLGGFAAKMHQFQIPGVGQLTRLGADWTGTARSWGEYTIDSVAQLIRRLPPDALDPHLAIAIRNRVEDGRSSLDLVAPPGALVHGDFRLENTLVSGDAVRSVELSAVLDFEMVLAGDGAMDLAWLYYTDGRDESDLAVLLHGYGVDHLEPTLEQRLLLYQIRYALEHLRWKAEFQDRTGVKSVQQRIRALLEGTLCHR